MRGLKNFRVNLQFEAREKFNLFLNFKMVLSAEDKIMIKKCFSLVLMVLYDARRPLPFLLSVDSVSFSFANLAYSPLCDSNIFIMKSW